MDFRCPRCGVVLDMERSQTHIQCASCGVFFRAEEALRTMTGGQDDVIDVRAEVIAPDRDTADIEEVLETGVDYGAAKHGSLNEEPPVYFARHFTVERRDGCGCSGCGCLAVLFLLLYLLVGCVATL